MIKVNVCIDVWNMTARAFLTKDFLPTNEIERIAYIESGGKIPEYEEDIYEILSERDKKRVKKIAEPINISGIRGTIEVDVDERKLLAFLLRKKEERIVEMEKEMKTKEKKAIEEGDFAFQFAKAILRGMERKGLEKIARAYAKYLVDEDISVSPLNWEEIWKKDREKGKIECGDVIELNGKIGKVVSSSSEKCVVKWKNGHEEEISVFQPNAKLIGFSDFEEVK